MNTIAFWNINRNVDVELISNLCTEHHLDILLLAEIGAASPIAIANAIIGRSGRVYTYVNPQSFRIKIFSALGGAAITPLIDHQYFSAIKVDPPLGPEYILVGLHLPSKLNQSADDQAIIAQRVSSRIAVLEEIHGIEKTIVVGDFNMNPFEHGLVNSDGFHAVMDRSVATRGARTVLFESKKFFYNPMWSLHGDANAGPSGSYFHQASSPLCYFWNLFDQAIFRPELLRYLPAVPVTVIDKIGDVNLLSAGVPNHEISDHLPIKLVFKSDNEV